MARLSKDDYYLNIAKAVSLRSTCLRRCYGAILVKNKEIIATGYNGAPRGAVNCCDTGFCARDAENAPHNKGYLDTCPSIHAETNCLLNVRRQDAVGSTLYLYGYDRKTEKPVAPAEPCVMCKRLLQNCGVARVVGYGAQEQYYDFLDAVTDAAEQISEDEELAARLRDALLKMN